MENFGILIAIMLIAIPFIILPAWGTFAKNPPQWVKNWRDSINDGDPDWN